MVYINRIRGAKEPRNLQTIGELGQHDAFHISLQSHGRAV